MRSPFKKPGAIVIKDTAIDPSIVQTVLAKQSRLQQEQTELKQKIVQYEAGLAKSELEEDYENIRDYATLLKFSRDRLKAVERELAQTENELQEALTTSGYLAHKTYVEELLTRWKTDEDISKAWEDLEAKMLEVEESLIHLVRTIANKRQEIEKKALDYEAAYKEYIKIWGNVPLPAPEGNGVTSLENHPVAWLLAPLHWASGFTRLTKRGWVKVICNPSKVLEG